MTRLISTIDTSSPEFQRSEEAMLHKISEIDAVFEQLAAAGGPRAVARHRDRGKLTARERIELLIDRDSPFLELCAVAAWGSDFPVGASIIGGIGTVCGVECVIIANDPTIAGGTSNPFTLKKQLRIMDIALKNRLPLMTLVESGGANLPTQSQVFIPGVIPFGD